MWGGGGGGGCVQDYTLSYQTMTLDLTYNAADTCTFCRLYKAYGEVQKNGHFVAVFFHLFHYSVHYLIYLQ